MNQDELRRLMTVSQFAEAHPWVTERAVRAWIFRAHENGFDRCIKRVGRRVLIDPDEVHVWIEDQTESPTVSRPVA